MVLTAVGAGVVFSILTFLDWRRYGWGGVAAVAVAWTVPATIAALIEPEVRPGLAPFWVIASIVSLGHPADWLLVMDQDDAPREMTRRQRWNANVSPWLLLAGIAVIAAVLVIRGSQ